MLATVYFTNTTSKQINFKGFKVPTISNSFSLDSVVWRRITDPDCTAFLVDFEYSLLGYDKSIGRLDMLLKYGSGGHCRRHRHVASTATLVLEGEQILRQTGPDGRVELIHRKKGDYVLAAADAHPHLEHGGTHGGTVLLSMTAPDGILFEYFDESMNSTGTVTIDQYVQSWVEGKAYGTV
jgi:hypothetical protein